MNEVNRYSIDQAINVLRQEIDQVDDTIGNVRAELAAMQRQNIAQFNRINSLVNEVNMWQSRYQDQLHVQNVLRVKLQFRINQLKNARGFNAGGSNDVQEGNEADQPEQVDVGGQDPIFVGGGFGGGGFGGCGGGGSNNHNNEEEEKEEEVVDEDDVEQGVNNNNNNNNAVEEEDMFIIGGDDSQEGEVGASDSSTGVSNDSSGSASNVSNGSGNKKKKRKRASSTYPLSPQALSNQVATFLLPKWPKSIRVSYYQHG